MTIDGAGSTVTLSSNDSTNINPGSTLTLSAGGVLTTGALYGSGDTTVTGAGSTLAAPLGINIGRGQVGSLTIADGGTVTSANSNNIGDFASVGTVIVTGANSSLSMTNTVYMGGFNAGTGILTLADGGTVTSAEIINMAATGSATINIGAPANATAVAPGTLNAPRLFGYNTGTSQINFNHTGTAYTFAPRISAAIRVEHNGPGTTFLTGANDYTGATTINAGALFVNNTLGTGTVTANSGGTLGGSGTIGGLTTIAGGGHLAPGGALGGAGSAGTLTFAGSLTLTAGAILDFQLGTTSDQIAVNGGVLTSNSGIVLNLSDAGGFAAGNYTLFDFSTGGTDVTNFHAGDFTFGTLPAGTTVGDFSLTLGATSLSLSYSGSAIPEPSTYAATAAFVALVCAMWSRSRRRGPNQLGSSAE
jgi:autotransporter-associated beta strand protein/T5SS/PEP-CTERM-associated repeat protein